MSDDKNTQPEIENENQELSEEELNDVAGGAISLGSSQISSFSWGMTNTGLSSPPVSSEILSGKKAV
jgi:hypothetical protein